MTYVRELTETLRDSTITEADRQTIWRSLQGLAGSGNEEAKAALATVQRQTSCETDDRNLLDLEPITAIANFQNRQRALYEKYKTEGLSASECVARFREGNINGALHYSLIEAAVRGCENASKTALYRYHLVDVYHRLKTTRIYDWPGREFGEATLSKYLPHEWLTRDLFEAMADMELHIKLNLGGNALDQSLKSHPCVERVRKIKTTVPGSYAWIPDSVNYVVYSLMQG
jgi:hypothetical protein